MKKLAFPLLILLSIATIVFLQFGFIFLLLALLPSLVAYYIDNNEEGHPRFKIVLACNLAALLPPLAGMVNALAHLRHYDVGPMMWDPAVWLLVYSGAAAGWCLIFLFRFIAQSIVGMLYEYNIASLEHLQKELLEEWGQQISQPPI